MPSETEFTSLNKPRANLNGKKRGLKRNYEKLKQKFDTSSTLLPPRLAPKKSVSPDMNFGLSCLELNTVSNFVTSEFKLELKARISQLTVCIMSCVSWKSL